MQGDWVRYHAFSSFVNDRSHNTSDRDGSYYVQTTNNNGRSKGGSCFGDSGGPVFLQNGTDHPDPGDHVIIGIVSYGMSPNCTGTDWSYRVDQPTVQDFVAGFLTLTP